MFNYAVLEPKSSSNEGITRKKKYLEVLDNTVKEQGYKEDILTGYQAIRLRMLFQMALQQEAPVLLPILDKEDRWPAYKYGDYFVAAARWHRITLQHNDVDAFRESWGRFERLSTSKSAHANGLAPSLGDVVLATWQKKPLILPPAELVPLIRPLTLEHSKCGRLPAPNYSELLRAVTIAAPNETALIDALLEEADKCFKGEAWLILARSRYRQAKGDVAGASALRQDTMAQAIEKMAAGNSYHLLVGTLREEAGSALAASDWANAMGAARAMFNVARSEQELSASLELAARASMKSDGGMESANAFLGLVNDEAAQPKEWREARLGEAWQQKLSAERRSIDAGVDPAAWRRRAWLAMVAGDGAGALSDAAAAYRLPDLADKSQELTLETAAMAFRAQAGSAAAAERFVKFQTRGPSAPEERSGLPATAKVDAAKSIETSWNAVKEMGDKGVGITELYAPVRDYAAWLSEAGRMDEALGAMHALYAGAASAKEIEMAVAGMASILRAREENLVRANAWRTFQRYGPAGPDGKIGTGDDLVDPLAGVTMKLPAGWADYWGKLAASNDARGSWPRAVNSWLIAGDTDAALAWLKKQRAGMAFQDAAWKEHLQYTTAALKAARGHTASGQDYADYMRYGAKGKDGKAGTADDLADPLEPLAKTASVATSPANAR